MNIKSTLRFSNMKNYFLWFSFVIRTECLIALVFNSFLFSHMYITIPTSLNVIHKEIYYIYLGQKKIFRTIEFRFALQVRFLQTPKFHCQFSDRSLGSKIQTHTMKIINKLTNFLEWDRILYCLSRNVINYQN